MDDDLLDSIFLGRALDDFDGLDDLGDGLDDDPALDMVADAFDAVGHIDEALGALRGYGECAAVADAQALLLRARALLADAAGALLEADGGDDA